MSIELPMLRLTNSEMTCWRDCRRKWWLAYHRGLKPKGQNFGGPLSIGTRVHSALEAYYIREGDERTDPLQVIRDSCAADKLAHPIYAKVIEDEEQLCTIMIEGYLQWLEETGNDADLEVLEPEGHAEVELFTAPDGTKVTMLSKIDARLRRRSDNARLALEHKTVGDLKQALPLLQMDSQLLTEHLVEFLSLREEGRDDVSTDGILYNMLRKVKRTAKAKPPFYGREEVRHNIHELRSHWSHVVSIARDILAARRDLDAGANHHEVVYPSPGRECTWKCDYFKVCTMFDDGSDVEAALTDLYEARDPLERYDKSQVQSPSMTEEKS